MVTTVRPKAAETPSRPIPTCGNPAAMTALPQPAKVSQKVPIASALHLRMSMLASSAQRTDWTGLIGGLRTFWADPWCGDTQDRRFQQAPDFCKPSAVVRPELIIATAAAMILGGVSALLRRFRRASPRDA